MTRTFTPKAAFYDVLPESQAARDRRQRGAPTTPRRVAIYCRISDDSREGAGLGVERQEADCREVCARQGWEVAEVYVDNDISAYHARKRRPAYERLLDDIEGGHRDGLVFWHSDRLHRSAKELEAFIETIDAHPLAIQVVRGGVVDLTTPEGRLMARQFGSLAVYESEHKADRIRRKHRELAEGGLPSGGGRHFGYEQTLAAIRDDEATLIREAAERILNGETLSAIVRDWRARNIPATRGGIWQNTSLKSSLVSPSIAGLRASRQLGILVEATWEPILDRQTWEKVRTILLAPGRQTTRYRRYLLSGLVKCGCGATMRHGIQTNGGQEIWRCFSRNRPDRGGCGSCVIDAQKVEALVWGATIAVLEQQEHLSSLQNLSARSESTANIEREARIVADEAQLAMLRDRVADGSLELADFTAMKARIQDRLEIARQATAAPRSHILANLQPGQVATQVASWPLERRTALVKAVWDQVIVASARRHPKRSVSDRVQLVPRRTHANLS